MYNNPRLNNLSELETLSKLEESCSICGNDMYIVYNSMEQQLGGTDEVYCSENRDHLFERARRTGEIWRIDKRGKKISNDD